MRKKFKTILIFTGIFLLMSTLTGCVNRFDNENQIVSPINTEYPIEGVYELKFFEDMEIKERVVSKAVNTICFNKEKVYLDDKLYSGVKYKTRIVDSSQYTVYYLKCSKSEAGIEAEKIQVISIYEKSNLVIEVLNLGKGRVAINIEGKLATMEKTQRKVSHGELSVTNSLSNEKEEAKQVSSTLLLGIRSKKEITNFEGDTEEDYDYKTFGINIIDQKVNSLEQASILIIPRKSGFWTIDNYSAESYGYKVKVFQSTMLSSWLGTKKSKENITLNLEKDFFKNDNIAILPMDIRHEKTRINFVCDKYLGFETVNIAEKNNIFVGEDHIIGYDMYTLDNIGQRRLNLQDVFSINNSANIYNISSSLDIKGRKLPNDNFTLKRNNGYWSVVSKVEDFTTSVTVSETVLNVNPVNDIINYDDLCVSWSSIKAKIPFAIDAYCSPNKDALVILTEKKLYVFSIVNGIIKDNIYEMNLKDGDTAIMAEWATGTYAKKWIDICSEYK